MKLTIYFWQMEKLPIEKLKSVKWVGIILPTCFAIAAIKWVPLSTWIDMNQGLLAFLGLLAAALVQVIPITANFLQSDQLTPVEASHLTKILENQQRYWVGLLFSTVSTFVIILVISILKELKPIPITNIGLIDITPALSGLTTWMVTFVICKMFGLFEGVISLQRLRSELVIAAAKRRAEDKAESAIKKAQLPQNIVPDDYGQIIRPH